MKIYKKGKSEESILFLHPFPFDHRIWKPQIDFFSKSYSCISYNILEKFETKKSISKVITMDSFVEDFFTVIKKIQYKKLNIIACSLGGYILLRALEKEILIADKYIFIGTKSEADNNETKLKRLIGIEDLQTNSRKNFLNNFFRNTVTENTLTSNKKMVKALQKIVYKRSTLSSQIALQAAMGRRDTTEILEKITTPTLVLCGEKDTITPVKSMQNFSDKIKGSKFLSVPNSAHICNFENPDFVNNEILNFLENSGK
jgi:3-oxoadipate enol-lactonase